MAGEHDPSGADATRGLPDRSAVRPNSSAVRPSDPGEARVRVDLVPDSGVVGSRGFGAEVAEASVEFAAPLGHPLDPDAVPPGLRRLAQAQGWSFIRLLFPFAVERAESRREFADIAVGVRLSSPRCTAVDLEPPRRPASGGLSPAGPLRPVHVDFAAADADPALPERVSVEATGYARSDLRWRLRDADGGALPPGDYVTAAVVAVPRGTTAIRGALDARVGVRRPTLASLTSLRRVTARTVQPVPFTVGLLPDRRSGLRPPVRAGSRTGPESQRLCVAVDVEGYGRRDLAGQLRAQHRLVQVLDAVGDAVGLHRSCWDRQEQGDGELALLPSGTVAAQVLPGLVSTLADLLDDLNLDLVEAARLRLRLALHEGEVYPGSNGYAGDAAVTVCRIRDSDRLRTVLRESPTANVAVAVSEPLYLQIADALHLANALRRQSDDGKGASKEPFAGPPSTTITMPAKQFRAEARMWALPAATT